MNTDKIGERYRATNGMEMEIIAYRGHLDVDVRFSDGTIVKHKQYRYVKNGQIQHPTYSSRIEKRQIGEKQIASCGMEMELIAYRSSEDIDVRFADGTVVKHCFYHSFKDGQITNPNRHIGETVMASCGMEMAIIAWHSKKDFDIRFADGTVKTCKAYDAFKKGQVKNPNFTPHEGETTIAKNGLNMTLITYRTAKDVDIKFSDGVIVQHKSYSNFKTGNIRHPEINANTKSRLGETRFANNGLEMTIIKYRKWSDIDVQFSNGSIVEHKSYNAFRNGEISLPTPPKEKIEVEKPDLKKLRLGETRIANNGMRMTIIRYDSATDITVRFENGAVVAHRAYGNFVSGNIDIPFEKPIGQIVQANNGLKAMIVDYTNNRNMKLRFEDGTIVTCHSFSLFKSGKVAHPHIGRRSDHLFYGVYTQMAFQSTDGTYYISTFSDGARDICTPQEIMKRINIPSAF